ncbi:hypothetical protein [Sporisorium scitamineum]|uniref:Uncharacterized protein n=1 Tax=Sporisorium scitamineum TaxID=49012 RepID=A0A0F7SCS5_9BASI|nr:hypothetical protein [Sporisorium scitamineum]
MVKGAKFVLGGMEGVARCGEVGKPLKQLQAGGREADGGEVKVSEAEGAEV